MSFPVTHRSSGLEKLGCMKREEGVCERRRSCTFHHVSGEAFFLPCETRRAPGEVLRRECSFPLDLRFYQVNLNSLHNAYCM